METATRKRIRLADSDYNRDHAFYLTLCTHQRQPWFAQYAELANDCVGLLLRLAEERGSELYAYCVMPDHVHILLRDLAPLEFIRLIKGRLTPLAGKHGIEGRFWQRSFFDRGLRSEDSVIEVARYIWQNPLRANLVSLPSEYPWSDSLVWPHWREEYGRG